MLGTKEKYKKYKDCAQHLTEDSLLIHGSAVNTKKIEQRRG
jgi:hypothetical protein